ncbi:MAG: DUF2520 domain-containing protein [Candidatus Competibacteraceae bacterium]|nr:DUF2520 domain-containing protein [Candidatus Competibacteraceae bacterium]
MLPITLLGAGNVAWQLGLALHKSGLQIIEVYSRTPQNAMLLASNLNASHVDSIENINPHQGIFICCVSDNAITTVAGLLPFKPMLLVHTSGSQPISILEPYSQNQGILYPLQSIHKNRDIDFSQIPICIEASHDDAFRHLNQLACLISQHVVHMSSEHRRQLHLAAVLVSNFTNYLYTQAEEYCNQHEIPFQLLHPLIVETAHRVLIESPSAWQTGPAFRHDTLTLQMHKDMLLLNPNLQDLYERLSQSIQNFYANHLNNENKKRPT